MKKSALLAACVALVMIAPELSHAQVRPDGPSNLVDWQPHWGDVSWVQALTIPAFAGGTAAIVFGVGGTGDPNFEGPLPLDEPVFDLMRANTASGQRQAAQISDFMWYGVMAYSVALEPVLVDLFFWDNESTAFRNFVVNLEALALSGFVVTVLQYSIRRERPASLECQDAQDPEACSRRGVVSFPSGHFALSATAAALTCNGGRRVGRYGTGAGFWTACLGTSAVALGVGLLRVTSNRHHFSDILVGGAVGAAVGVIYPELLYYEDEPEDPEKTWRLVPSLGEGAGLSLIRRF